MKRVEGLYPYDDYYLYKIFHKKEQRNYVVLIPKNKNDNLKRKTISFARYLLSTKLKRFLKPNEEVDHIDNNKLNDDINNLQILSKSENIRKCFSDTGTFRKYVRLECPICHKIFEIPKNQSFLQKNQKYSCCSKECSNKMRSLTKSNSNINLLSKLIQNNFIEEFTKEQIIGSTHYFEFSKEISIFDISEKSKYSKFK